MKLSRTIGHFRFDRALAVTLALAAIVIAGRAWLAEHPQHDPWGPLDLRDPRGWATAAKLAALRRDPDRCRAVLDRSAIAFNALEPAGEGACRRTDRTVVPALPIAPSRTPTTCAVAAGTKLWLRETVQPAARAHLGADVASIDHLGAYSCRRINGGETGRWSEHARGNAIDIAAFVLSDGRRISVLGDWQAGDERTAFLRRVRDGACKAFGTVLSPDYNAAHRDHLHLDQAPRGSGSFCR